MVSVPHSTIDLCSLSPASVPATGPPISAPADLGPVSEVGEVCEMLPHGTRRPDQRAMGQAGAVAAQGQEVGAATHLEQTPVDRRDPLADTDGRAMAGRAGPLWALADRLWAVPALAARRHLEADPHRTAGPGRPMSVIVVHLLSIVVLLWLQPKHRRF
jgi:hypothetical protein